MSISDKTMYIVYVLYCQVKTVRIIIESLFQGERYLYTHYNIITDHYNVYQ